MLYYIISTVYNTLFLLEFGSPNTIYLCRGIAVVGPREFIKMSSFAFMAYVRYINVYARG